MIRAMNLQEAQKITGGELSGINASFESVSIDSRTLQPNDLFIAISGPNFNGNKFVDAAVNNKAAAAIVSEDVQSSIPLLKVEDTRIALGQLGAMNRQKSSACVIALTGSQGKTTVKEMIAQILCHCGDVHYTKGNLNNDYGVPLSLLSIDAEHSFSVIEMGASGPGEIAYCVDLTRPQIAHITNVAATHIEGFGDLNGVAKAKGEIWEGLSNGGTAVLNIDDAFAESWSENLEINENVSTITISAEGKENAHYFLSEVKANENLSVSFTLHTPVGIKPLTLNLLGKHNCANALAAAALSMVAGANLEDVEKGLASVKAVNGRLCSLKGMNSSSIIDDSYNASPSSFKAAIDVLSELTGESILVCGDMGEMGDEVEAAHVDIGIYAKEKGINHLFATGVYSQLAAQSFGEEAVVCEERDGLAKKIIPLLHQGVTVLVKGSRSAGMEKVVQMLLAEEG